ncbi:hypothetical protein [Azohydromonas sediminis]|uniref:DISARM anti-phage system protein DrmE domain-containing protein n=1 Tax=Azohydromonas sediminis TaxID=2259674 RepID=UPI0013C3576A|nr:hypothetical protein [Azohydromonas sediminis]
MWDGAIQSSTQRVTDALLHRAVLPASALAFEKVSGAIAVRAALRRQAANQSLLFAVPEVNAATARHVVAALLIGDHAHTNGQGQLPDEEVRRLLRGDVVLVTQAISDSKAELESLPIGRGLRLSDVWEVATLSRYTAATSPKPRVFLANPGWLAKMAQGRRFGAVIIDASHPTTFSRLPELLSTASGCTQLRIGVSPPPSDSTLSACGYPSRLAVWLWDPQARHDAQTVVESSDPVEHTTGERFLWVCDSDAEASQALAEVYKWLVAAARAADGRHYPGLRQCWGIYNRMRQVAVPLAQLEQVAASSWAGNLRRRIEELDSVGGHGTVAWDTTWPQLVAAVKEAYGVLLRRQETAKFWAVASSLESFLASMTPHLRVVVGSESELSLLLPALEEVVDGLTDALASGRVEFVTGSKEARLIAEGHVYPTVLMAPRTDGLRYLDVFPSVRVDELVYPHELDVARANQSRIHAPWVPLLKDEARVRFLEPLGFRPPRTASPRRVAGLPKVVATRADGHRVALVTPAQISATLDIDSLLDAPGSGAQVGYEGSGESSSVLSGDIAEVAFTNGERRQFYANQKVDVFLSETGTIERHLALELRPGWHVITFVDRHYDGLFQRLAEVVGSRLPPDQRVALELWRTAKRHLAERHPNKRQLHSRLVDRGLKSDYATFLSWVRDDEDAVIAPQQFEDFQVLACEIETYAKSRTMLESAFRAVQHERGRNRAMGRTLRRFLRAVVSGDGYEEALAGARSLDAAVADVFAAVEVLVVDSVRRIQRTNDA